MSVRSISPVRKGFTGSLPSSMEMQALSVTFLMGFRFRFLGSDMADHAIYQDSQGSELLDLQS